ncbi:MAG: hypothetical protein V5A27_06760, partial [Halapricum sp.]
PQANFQTDYDASALDTGDSFGNDSPSSDGGILTVTHTSGDPLEANNLYLIGGVGDRVEWGTDADSYGAGSTITAGDSVDYAVSSDDTVRVIWEGGDGSSAELKKWTGPDA